MDIPRYTLIAASVFLGLMLLGEWTRFSTALQEASLPAVPMVDTLYIYKVVTNPSPLCLGAEKKLEVLQLLKH